MEEKELIHRLRDGDNSAYRLIIDRYQTSVLNCCFKFVRHRETAEDLTQDVFIEVYRSIHMFRSASKFSTWLLRIAISKSLDHIKSQKRKKRFGYLKSIFSGDDSEERALSSDLHNPQQLLENEDRVQLLSWAIESLPDNQKIALTLSKYDERSYKEIADILHTTIPAVESLIVRAKSNMKKKLYAHYKKHL
ncbi:MAG: RNA polymerase sigma factor [Ignavibacteriales bacterium]|nr:RNA polymerase sigma factor [Ignavibacteriales bacterium]